MIKLEGFEDLTLAKHHPEVQTLVKLLAEQNAIFPGVRAVSLSKEVVGVPLEGHSGSEQIRVN